MDGRTYTLYTCIRCRADRWIPGSDRFGMFRARVCVRARAYMGSDDAKRTISKTIVCWLFATKTIRSIENGIVYADTGKKKSPNGVDVSMDAEYARVRMYGIRRGSRGTRFRNVDRTGWATVVRVWIWYAWIMVDSLERRRAIGTAQEV